MPPKRDEAALQEEEELQLAIALSQSEAEEKERMVGCTAEISLNIITACLSRDTDNILPLFVHLQRQKNSYSMYPKADPTPVTSSAPPVSTLYTSPVVRLLHFGKLNYLHYQTTFMIKTRFKCLLIIEEIID